ncbi:SNF5-domain-containing protein [Pluteus cervinus]|uniref:SNF5-domain-containing protein n=1 Tax=Pluteus cervinus TaxID=181527 RepID=A0ACD3AZJ8_9AGAR|nr:SNF5-domain-containing protein [Pluteus cervinus]
MAENSNAPSFPPANAFGNMSDYQLRQTISQLSTAAGNATYASPAPQTARNATYLKNLHTWSTTTPPKTPVATSRPSRARTTRTTQLAAPPTTYTNTAPVRVAPVPIPQPIVPAVPPNPPRAPIPTTPQAYQSTYGSRLRTGCTLLMQPVLVNTAATSTRAAARRGGAVNYADPGSGDDLPDAGALDSDDSDFVASGGTRTAIRQSRARMGTGMTVFNSTTGVSSPAPMQAMKQLSTHLDQTYLGMIPPSRFIKSRIIEPMKYEPIHQDVVDRQAQRRSALVPIRVEFETDTHRIRDCFVWNIHETTITPETFAATFCNDLDLSSTWADTIANQIRAQLEDHEGVASMELGQDGALEEGLAAGDEIPECRVILSIDVQIANHHLMDHIEWDLLSPLSPEVFAQKLCIELGLGGEAIPLVAHAVHEEIMKHKKDAIEWGVIGGEKDTVDETAAGAEKPRDKSGFGLVKDKTGLGLGWGRAPKDGRGPKILRGVWRDWVEAEEFKTQFEELTVEEVERREVERERASRRLRRETSKFQSSARRRR